AQGQRRRHLGCTPTPPVPRGDDGGRERPKGEQEAEGPEVGQLLQEEGVGVAGDRRRPGMSVPVQLVVAGPNAAEGVARKGIEGRMPELRPATAARGE